MVPPVRQLNFKRTTAGVIFFFAGLFLLPLIIRDPLFPLAWAVLAGIPVGIFICWPLFENYRVVRRAALSPQPSSSTRSAESTPVRVPRTPRTPTSV